jgi:hypothetical protein
VNECGGVPFEAPKERSRVCFGGFRLPARSRFGEGRPDEACGGATGFSPRGLHSWLSRGIDISHVKIKGTARFREKAVQDWLLRKEQEKKKRNFELGEGKERCVAKVLPFWI